MRKIVPILFFVILASCSKAPDCDCGTVEGSRVDFPDGTVESEIWFLDIRNECTGSILTDIQVEFNVYRSYTFDATTQRICNISEKRLN
ncbi:MAG: hypothetical protein ACPGYU_02165 [Flavobacteriaceae bacterium]